MKWMKRTGLFITVVVAGALFGGCTASMQARNVDVNETTLVNPNMMEKGTGDQALYRFVNPQVVMRNYSKVMLDPVLVRKDGELSSDDLENYQRLANNAYVYLSEELGKDYSIVQIAEPGAFRVQMAIVNADSSKPIRNTLSTVMPIGIGLSAVKYAATGKPSGVGEITMEMKVTDATSGQLLGAALDRRVGGKTPSGIIDTWYNADEALKYWAKRLAYVLCNMRAGTNCVAP